MNNTKPKINLTVVVPVCQGRKETMQIRYIQGIHRKTASRGCSTRGTSLNKSHDGSRSWSWSMSWSWSWSWSWS